MNTLKGWITTTCLAAMLMVSATTAKADGVIIYGATAPAPCTASPTTKAKSDFGVIIVGLTGVIIYGFTGVIITGAPAPVENCSVIITG